MHSFLIEKLMRAVNYFTPRVPADAGDGVSCLRGLVEVANVLAHSEITITPGSVVVLRGEFDDVTFDEMTASFTAAGAKAVLFLTPEQSIQMLSEEDMKSAGWIPATYEGGEPDGRT